MLYAYLENNEKCSTGSGVSIFQGVWVYVVDRMGIRASSSEYIQSNIWNIADSMYRDPFQYSPNSNTLDQGPNTPLFLS